MVRILFLAADPTDATRLRLGKELREIQEKIQLAKSRERFALHQRMSVRPADMSQALLDVNPEIVHFSGHGTESGALCVEDVLGKMLPVNPTALAALFEQFKDQVKCVVLNACYSTAQAAAIAQHIDYVIGMNQAIGDRAAIAFSIGFYQALGAGRSIEEAYKLGRVQIELENIPEHLTPVLIKSKIAEPTKPPSIQPIFELPSNAEAQFPVAKEISSKEFPSITLQQTHPTSQSADQAKQIHSLWEKTSAMFPNYRPVKYIESQGQSHIFVVQDSKGDQFVIKRTTKEYVSRTTRNPLNCSDPYIVDDEQYIEDGDNVFVFRRYIEGASISEIIARNSVGVRGTLLGFWTRAIMERISALQQMNPPVIHRDISPGNIIIGRDDLQPYLIDLKSSVAHTIRVFPVVGTPRFVAPEQIQGEAQLSSDLYSLGMLIFYMASAQLPPSISERLADKKGKDAELLKCVGDRGGASPANIWLPKLIALNPKERYSNAREALMSKYVDATTPQAYLGKLNIANNIRVEMWTLHYDVIRE